MINLEADIALPSHATIPAADLGSDKRVKKCPRVIYQTE